MGPGERVVLVKSMLAQTAPSGTIEAVLESRSAVAGRAFDGGGGSAAAASETEAQIQSGLQKLARGREDLVTPEELDRLEAIVLPENRPVVFVREAGYDPLDGMWEHLNQPELRERITPLLRSVGRIELPDSPWIPFGGTGFLVGNGLMMTNRHVARLFADGVGTTRRLAYRAGGAAVDLRRWVDSSPDDRSDFFDVVGVEMIHPFWDMALLRVEGLPDGFTPLSLSVRSPEDLAGRDVVAVGYPARDDRNDLDLQDRIFSRQYNVKRLQPGKLRPRERIQSFESLVDAVTHDSSTMGGNSGSAIIDVQTGEVVGLHFAGVYLKANYAVPTFELARDRRIVDLGLNFKGTAAPTDAWASAWARAGDAEASPPAGQEPTAGAGPGSGAQPPPLTSTAPATPGTVTFTVPLTITVSIGLPVPAGSASPGAPVTAAVVGAPAEVEAFKLQVPVIYGGLERRAGYDGTFLDLPAGEAVPLPELTALGLSVVAKLRNGTNELKYHKFSVVVHRGRRLALFTASNVDWRDRMRRVKGKKPTRNELTGLDDWAIEQWVTDWRIPEKHQLPDVFFTEDRGAFDKGHLVRRDDVCWGPTFEDIQKGNGDTYHTTNCSPQTAAFNQAARGVDNWGDLESLVQAATKAEASIIFSGPVLADDDKRFRGRDGTGTTLIQIPKRFWKIVVVKGAAGPEAYGFLLEQSLADVRLEFAVPAAWRRHACKIEEIEGLLYGLARLPWLKNVDRFDSQEGVSIATDLQ